MIVLFKYLFQYIYCNICNKTKFIVGGLISYPQKGNALEGLFLPIMELKKENAFMNFLKKK